MANNCDNCELRPLRPVPFVTDPNFIKVLDSQSYVVTFRDGEEYLAMLKKFDAEVADVMKKAGLKVVREPYK